MKNLIVFAVVSVMFFSSYAYAAPKERFDEFVLKAGVDLAGSARNIESDSSTESKTGVSAAFEYFAVLVPAILKLGAGMEFMFPRLYDVPGSSRFAFFPVYVTAKISPIRGFPEVFIKGNYGTSFFYQDDVDSLARGNYFAVGAGVDVAPYEDASFIIEFMYSVSEGSFKEESGNKSYDVKYSKLGINVGLRY